MPIKSNGDFARPVPTIAGRRRVTINQRTPQNRQHRILYIDEQATSKESLRAQKEGGRIIKRTVKLYNLDAIIAVGYRISSSKGTAFRKWAAQTLRSYITDGYAINPTRIERNHSQFTKALEDLKLVSASTTLLGAT